MMNYNNALKILENFVKCKEPESLNRFDLAKARLMELLDQKNLFGKDVNAEISEVIYYQLNPLARRLIRKSFIDLCEQSDYKQLGTPENFDLDDFIDECDDILFGRCGLVGLGMHCSSRLFLAHFQTRLRRRLGINQGFKRKHVLKWVRTVVEKISYLPVDDKENVVNNWVNRMMTECSINNQLDVQFVYEHVDYALQELNSNSPLSAIYDLLE